MSKHQNKQDGWELIRSRLSRSPTQRFSRQFKLPTDSAEVIARMGRLDFADVRLIILLMSYIILLLGESASVAEFKCAKR